MWKVDLSVFSQRSPKDPILQAVPILALQDCAIARALQTLARTSYIEQISLNIRVYAFITLP